MTDPPAKSNLDANLDGRNHRRLGVEILRTMPQANVAEAYGALRAAFADVVGRPPSWAEGEGIERWVSHFPAAVDAVEEVCRLIRQHDGRPRRWSELVGSIEGGLYLAFPLDSHEVGALRAPGAKPTAITDPRDLGEIAAGLVARARERRRAA